MWETLGVILEARHFSDGRFTHMLNQIKESRQKDNKNINNCYAVINTDEPYFGEIKIF